MSRVCIVGGNVAGLSVADALLSEDGRFEIDIYEKHIPLVGEPIPCAGGVTKWFLEEKLKLKLPDEVILARINRVRFFAPNMEYVESKGEFGYVLDRYLLQMWMLGKVMNRGAKVVVKEISEDDLESFYLNQTYDYIVGADGLLSTVVKWLALALPPPKEIYHCVQQNIRWDDYPQDLIGIYFGRKIAPFGYAWTFPCGNNEVRVGLGIPLSLRENPMTFLGKFRDKLGISKNPSRHLISKLVPVAKPRRTHVYRSRVFLVGDAGLHTGPFGGGILQAIFAGRMCAKAIAEGKPEKFDSYVRWLHNRNKKIRRVTEKLMNFDDEKFNDLAEALRGVDFPWPLDEPKNMVKLITILLRRKPSIFF